MPGLRVIVRAEPVPLLSRAGEAIAIVFGYLVLLIGLIVAVPTVVLLTLLVIVLAIGDTPEIEGWLVFAALVPGSVFLLWLGLRIVRGRRQLVLFLRRFGFSDASKALTVAVGTAMGRRWRLITLDDSQTPSVGVSAFARRGFGLGRWVLLLLFVALCAYGVIWWLGGGFDNFLDGVWEDASGSSEASGGNPLEAFFAGLIATMVVGLIFLLFLIIFGLGALGSLLVGTIFSWRVHDAIERAEDSKALSVSDGGAITQLVRRVADGARGIYSARFAVVKVTNDIWQQAVQELSTAASVVLIDVSEPSENLLWEVAMLKRHGRARIVLIARKDRAEALSAMAGDAGLAAEITEQLAGEDILAYVDPKDEREMRRFATSLGSMLRSPDQPSSGAATDRALPSVPR